MPFYYGSLIDEPRFPAILFLSLLIYEQLIQDVFQWILFVNLSSLQNPS